MNYFGHFELKTVLPIGFELIRGAVILGNDSTPTILVANFKRATGTFGFQTVRFPPTFVEAHPVTNWDMAGLVEITSGHP